MIHILIKLLFSIGASILAIILTWFLLPDDTSIENAIGIFELIFLNTTIFTFAGQYIGERSRDRRKTA